jgi:hypothetical protein
VVVYLWGWRVVRKREVGRKIVWLFALLFAATLFWLLPITSDLYNYLTRAHMFTDLGANPLLDAPSDFLDDQLMQAYLAPYAVEPSIYGPAWVLVSAPGTLGQQDVTVGSFYLKGLAVLAYLACAWLVERILLQTRPDRSVEGLYLFAWNPLVVMMAVGDGHNDVVMMAFVLLATWLLLQERWALSFGVLALSVWIKYVSVIYLPLFAVFAWYRLDRSQRWPVLARATFSVLAFSALVLAPFWQPEWFRVLGERLIQPSNWQAGASNLVRWTLGLGLSLFVASYAILIWRMVRQAGSVCNPGRHGNVQRLLDAGFVVSLLVFVLGAARSQPWHLIWPAAWAGLSQRRWAWPAIAVLSVAMLAAQFWVEWGAPGWRMPS